MAIKVRIWWDTTTDSYVVSSVYNEKLISALKDVIPASDRSFDPQTKFWHVKENYGDFIRKISESAFSVSSVSFVSRVVSQQQSQKQYQQSYSNQATPGAQQTRQQYYATSASTAASLDSTILTFFRLLPYDAAKRAYREAATKYHPDKSNGDHGKMSQLNELWTRIEKEVFGR